MTGATQQLSREQKLAEHLLAIAHAWGPDEGAEFSRAGWATIHRAIMEAALILSALPQRVPQAQADATTGSNLSQLLHRARTSPEYKAGRERLAQADAKAGERK